MCVSCGFQIEYPLLQLPQVQFPRPHQESWSRFCVRAAPQTRPEVSYQCCNSLPPCPVGLYILNPYKQGWHIG